MRFLPPKINYTILMYQAFGKYCVLVSSEAGRTSRTESRACIRSEGLPGVQVSKEHLEMVSARQTAFSKNSTQGEYSMWLKG